MRAQCGSFLDLLHLPTPHPLHKPKRDGSEKDCSSPEVNVCTVLEKNMCCAEKAMHSTIALPTETAERNADFATKCFPQRHNGFGRGFVFETKRFGCLDGVGTRAWPFSSLKTRQVFLKQQFAFHRLCYPVFCCLDDTLIESVFSTLLLRLMLTFRPSTNKVFLPQCLLSYGSSRISVSCGGCVLVVHNGRDVCQRSLRYCMFTARRTQREK